MSFVSISYLFITLLIIAGFCESSLGHVERFNVEKSEWEELTQVQVPRTKFASVPTQNPHEFVIIGGKDQ
jgi:hypothetical protein